MKPGVVWKISVATTAVAEAAVAELLGSVFGQPTATYTDFETGRTSVAIYCQRRPPGLRAKRAAWRDGLAGLRGRGLDPGVARVALQRIPRENWAESWKRHFKPLEIGAALLVKPSWIKRRARPGQAIVVLDPGLSFGTGQHPTTSFCLREIVRRRHPGTPQAMLDIGTGSGILAIAAVKLGYAPVHAFDFDPESVRVARTNARVNRVARRLRLTRRDLTRLPLAATQRYDLVCANLISTVLLAERERIVRRLRPAGVLVVAGILNSEFRQVRAAFEPHGLRLVAHKREKEWTSGTFVLER